VVKLGYKKLKIPALKDKVVITGVFIVITFIMFYLIMDTMTENYREIERQSGLDDTETEESATGIDISKDRSQSSNPESSDTPEEKIFTDSASEGNSIISKDTSKSDVCATTPAATKAPEAHYIPLGIEKAKGEEILTITSNYFQTRIPHLIKSLSESSFYYTERLLDESTGTCVYILARNSNYASNLNGYFYYLFDKSNSSLAISPLVLNISALFEEDDRKTVFENKSYAKEEQKQALRNSLEAILGKFYTDEVFEFIFSGYKETFNRRITGISTKSDVYKLVYKDLEVIFHDSFITYVEFYIKNAG